MVSHELSPREHLRQTSESPEHESTFFRYASAMVVIAFRASLRLPQQASYLHHDQWSLGRLPIGSV